MSCMPQFRPDHAVTVPLRCVYKDIWTDVIHNHQRAGTLLVQRLGPKQVHTLARLHMHCACTPGSSDLVHLQVDDRQLLVLISQLRLNSPQAKPQLQRVIYNLGQHHGTLRAVLRLVLALLRSPLSPDEAETAMEEDGASAPRSLQDALQVMTSRHKVAWVTSTRPLHSMHFATGRN